MSISFNQTDMSKQNFVYPFYVGQEVVAARHCKKEGQQGFVRGRLRGASLLVVDGLSGAWSPEALDPVFRPGDDVVVVYGGDIFGDTSSVPFNPRVMTIGEVGAISRVIGPRNGAEKYPCLVYGGTTSYELASGYIYRPYWLQHQGYEAFKLWSDHEVDKWGAAAPSDQKKAEPRVKVNYDFLTSHEVIEQARNGHGAILAKIYRATHEDGTIAVPRLLHIIEGLCRPWQEKIKAAFGITDKVRHVEICKESDLEGAATAFLAATKIQVQNLYGDSVNGAMELSSGFFNSEGTVNALWLCPMDLKTIVVHRTASGALALELVEMPGANASERPYAILGRGWGKMSMLFSGDVAVTVEKKKVLPELLEPWGTSQVE